MLANPRSLHDVVLHLEKVGYGDSAQVEDGAVRLDRMPTSARAGWETVKQGALVLEYEPLELALGGRASVKSFDVEFSELFDVDRTSILQIVAMDVRGKSNRMAVDGPTLSVL